MRQRDPGTRLLAYTSAPSTDVMPRPPSHAAHSAFPPAPGERARHRIGLSGLILFTFGVLLAPIAHNVGHRADHFHRDGHFAFALNALRGQLDAHAQAHAHGHPHLHPHSENSPHAQRESDYGHGSELERSEEPLAERDHDERRGSDPRHGEGSLAHFAAAVLAPALYIVPPASAEADGVVPAMLESVCDGRAAFGPIQPRAPPA